MYELLLNMKRSISLEVIIFRWTNCLHIASSWQTSFNPQLFLLCRSGACAEQAAKLFDGTNFAQFHVLRRGIIAWEQAGKPVKRGK
jgi:rhodanese-related sulfurtransferase